MKGRHVCPILPCFSPDVPYVFTDTALIGYLRDDIANQVVYFLPEPSTVETCGNNEQVLYNFNLNVGDTMSNCFISLLDEDSPISGFGGIDSIANIDLFGKERKVLHLELPINKGLIFLSTSGLIEGIGTGVYDPIHYNYEHAFRNFCEGSLFQCQITSSTKNIYKSELQLNPNPSTGMISVDGNKNIINAKFTDVVGQSSNINVLNAELNISDLKPGIYFVTLTDSNNHQYFSKIVKL